MLLTMKRTNPTVQLPFRNNHMQKHERCGRRQPRDNKLAQRLDTIYERQLHIITRATWHNQPDHRAVARAYTELAT